jgi:diguanylate cyclase (GGDEF)-like protein
MRIRFPRSGHSIPAGPRDSSGASLAALRIARFSMEPALSSPSPAAGAPSVRLVETAPDPDRVEALVESYRRLADTFHDVLAEQSLEALLDRIADTLEELMPHDSMTIYEADEALRILRPVLARDQWASEILDRTLEFGEGITGWAALHREAVFAPKAHLDPRVKFVPGTPEDEVEALISVPLIARDQLKGALNIYRVGDDAAFSDDEFELIKRFGDAAALALDNAQVRARLEHQAQTDSLTGLFNHRYFHDRLRAELQRVSRVHDSVAVLMLDIDDFKRVNDVHGHGTGDEILRELAKTLVRLVRGTDVVCRLGGEEFAVILPSCDETAAMHLADRLTQTVAEVEFESVGRITLSVGLAQGPEHAMNPRELIACAEAAMMTAKVRGKNAVVVFDEETSERPQARPAAAARDVRSIAHLKMLQSLSGKLNRLNDSREIGMAIANELRSLIDYHNCRVFVIDDEYVRPIAFQGDLPGAHSVREALTCKVGEGITGHVARTGQSVLAPDAANSLHARIIKGTPVIDESLLAVPLNHGTRTVGVIVISKLGLDQFDEDDQRLLEVLAGHAAVALENARLYEAERREAESARALLEFSRDLAVANGMEEVLERVVERSAAILASPQSSVWLQDPATGELAVCAMHGFDARQRHHALALRYPAEAAGRIAGSAEPFTMLAGELSALTDGTIFRHDFAIAPLLLDGGRHGCIAVAVPTDATYGDRELTLLAGIAHQARLAIANAGSFESLEETFLSTVEALANALEASDEYTSSHARWISDLAIRVGRKLGLDGAALKRLELGALFHDIGKIGIPAAILAKPGRLTAEERAIIQEHPVLGERIIAPIERLQEVRPIVRHCHEHFDGSGYPDKLVGDDIPLEARIILCCDAFHAMTTDRPYRKRLSTREAIRRLEENAGGQFDPAVVEICVSLVRSL